MENYLTQVDHAKERLVDDWRYWTEHLTSEASRCTSNTDGELLREILLEAAKKCNTRYEELKGRFNADET